MECQCQDCKFFICLKPEKEKNLSKLIATLCDNFTVFEVSLYQFWYDRHNFIFYDEKSIMKTIHSKLRSIQ